MKGYVLITVLMAMFVSTAVFAQDPSEGQFPPEEAMERRMHLRNMQLDLRQREAEMDFNQKMREIELQKHRMALKNKQQSRKHPGDDGAMPLLLAICCIVHILVAVWVYQDIRRRNSGSGIWIVIALLTGLLGALVYAVVRIGDTPQPKS